MTSNDPSAQKSDEGDVAASPAGTPEVRDDEGLTTAPPPAEAADATRTDAAGAAGVDAGTTAAPVPAEVGAAQEPAPAAQVPAEEPEPPVEPSELELARGEIAGLRVDLEAGREEAKKLQERMLRVAADFDNYKKRARRELTDSVTRAENRVVLDFLPIVDNLERAILHGGGSEPGEGEAGTLLAGVRMVQKQFLAAMARHDVLPFETVGQPFDPELHEALQQAPSELPRNTVVQELQKGYRRGEQLVRPAMVIVSMGPAEPVPEAAPAVEAESPSPAETEAPPETTQPTGNEQQNQQQSEQSSAAEEAAGSESEKKSDD